MTSILLDTDVLLDYLLDRRDHAEWSQKVLLAAQNMKLKAFVTPVALSNLYYLLRKEASHHKVIKTIKVLLKYLHVASTGKEVVELALNSQFTDFEDAIQNFSAIKQGDISFILTRNLKDYRTSEILVMSPKEYSKAHLL